MFYENAIRVYKSKLCGLYKSGLLLMGFEKTIKYS